MQLRSLLNKITVTEISGSSDREITSLAYDSRRVVRGSLFIALRGAHADGADYVSDAIERGAEAIVTDRPCAHSRVTAVQVPDARAALADLSATFYRYPASRLKLAGITGTNGKTTTAFLLKYVLECAGWRAGLLGTVRYEVGERILPAARTTPESLEIQDLLAQVVNAGGKAAVMEVSSHALAQQRVRGLEFNAAIFTNLTQDHLDYHHTMGAYFAAKSLLFEQLASQTRKEGVAVINTDDAYGEKLARRFEKEVPVVTYGVGAGAMFRAGGFQNVPGQTTYQLEAGGKSYLVRLPLIGRFNIYNSLAAIAGANAMGVPVRDAVKAMATAPQVPGRLEAVPVKRKFQVYVDYAHTDDALINVLRTLRELGPRRLVVVFGCGGDRDRAKRPKMGAAASEHADYAIVTSDNPRKEDPGAIIADIVQAMRPGTHEVVPDRQEAIFRAIAMAQPQDIILVAGKGHETYQEFADHTVPFNDVDVILSAVGAQPVKMMD